MEGGTTFHFVTDGIHAALELARAAAGDANISIAGGATTVNQFLAAVSWTSCGCTSRRASSAPASASFDGVPAQKLERVSVRAASLVTHITYRPVRS
jgi:dihydrofolate reductase